MKLHGPAIALLEIESIARGLVVCDALVKRAAVHIALADTTTPGKYLVLFHGGVGEVEEALAAGVDVAGPSLLDRLFLPIAADDLVAGLEERFTDSWGESIGIVETQTVASGLLAADAALKRAEVRLTRLKLARNIGGKAYFTLTGSLHMVQAALDAAAAVVTEPLLVAVELIHNPHRDLRGPVF